MIFIDHRSLKTELRKCRSRALSFENGKLMIRSFTLAKHGKYIYQRRHQDAIVDYSKSLAYSHNIWAIIFVEKCAFLS